jgi:alkanesulfonate monooxygenase SsuD/methylene tetrahydromethanopterin reductase-like flavin-dependent oxidoreductase (luciferase family)
MERREAHEVPGPLPLPKRVRFSLSSTMGYEFGQLVEKCAVAESLGFQGIYASDHMHGVAGVPVDVPFMEPWTLLAALAGHARRLRLGVLVSGVTYRHPSMLAKIAGTLDVISGGRLDLGLGASWSREDHVAYGLAFPELRERLERLEEAVELICGLWTHERFSFAGRHYRLENAPLAPRPVQASPPILLAGASPRLLRLVARRARQWVSVSTAAFAGECVRAIEAHCRAIGRDPAEIEFAQSSALVLSDSRAEVENALAGRGRPVGSGSPDTAQGRIALPDEPPEARALATLFAGNADAVRAQIQRYVDAGVTHFILQAPPPLDVKMLERFRCEVMDGFAC